MPVRKDTEVEILSSKYNLCAFCYNKIIRFEKALDNWLENEYPYLYLDDVLGWYTLCINNPCQRDCLESTYPEIPGCTCCPHLQNLSYHRYRIDRMLMPTSEWISQNILN